MRSFVKTVIFDIWTFLCIRLYCRRWKYLIVCDIDNTIADTWRNIKNGKIPYSSLPYFNEVLKFISFKLNDKTGIIFLSWRPMDKFLASRSWLRQIGFNISIFQLILSPSPMSKVKFLKKLLRFCSNVVYIDDLSFNHENGEVKYYSDLLKKVADLDLEYIDFSEIKKLQNKSSAIYKI